MIWFRNIVLDDAHKLIITNRGEFGLVNLLSQAIHEFS